MEFKEVIGTRRSVRYFDPDRPVEDEKIQIMLEAANRSSRSINADYIKAVVVLRDELDPEVLEQLKTPTNSWPGACGPPRMVRRQSVPGAETPCRRPSPGSWPAPG